VVKNNKINKIFCSFLIFNLFFKSENNFYGDSDDEDVDNKKDLAIGEFLDENISLDDLLA